MERIYTICLFDGASSDGDYECAVVLQFDLDVHFHFSWYGGRGHNGRAELLAL